MLSFNYHPGPSDNTYMYAINVGVVFSSIAEINFSWLMQIILYFLCATCVMVLQSVYLLLLFISTGWH